MPQNPAQTASFKNQKGQKEEAKKAQALAVIHVSLAYSCQIKLPMSNREIRIMHKGKLEASYKKDLWKLCHERSDMSTACKVF